MMTAITTLQSTPCPTPEAATASLQGSILEFGRGGHEVNVRGIDIREMDDGTFIALAIIEIEEIEEEQEEKPEKSSTMEAEELIERENELFWLTHGSRGSLAEDSLPETDGPVDATEQMDNPGYMEDREASQEPLPEELADTFENDFSEAMSPEPPPPGTITDTVISSSTAAMTPEELREEEERVRARHDELLAAIAARDKRIDEDGPRPAPEE